MTNQAQIAAELRGEVPIPNNELGVPARFAQLSDEDVAKALKNGSLAFVAEYTSTTPVSLMERRAKALGRRLTAEKRIPTLTRLARLTDAEFDAMPKSNLVFLAQLYGVDVVELARRRSAQRIVLGITPKPVKASKIQATVVAPKTEGKSILELAKPSSVSAKRKVRGNKGEVLKEASAEAKRDSRLVAKEGEVIHSDILAQQAADFTATEAVED